MYMDNIIAKYNGIEIEIGDVETYALSDMSIMQIVYDKKGEDFFLQFGFAEYDAEEIDDVQYYIPKPIYAVYVDIYDEVEFCRFTFSENDYLETGRCPYECLPSFIIEAIEVGWYTSQELEELVIKAKNRDYV